MRFFHYVLMICFPQDPCFLCWFSWIRIDYRISDLGSYLNLGDNQAQALGLVGRAVLLWVADNFIDPGISPLFVGRPSQPDEIR